MVIGICGKSGSGKSFICRELEKMGAFVINADAIGKEIMTGEVLRRVETVFPDCFENGVLNRRKLGSVVFNNSEKLEHLNKITHPAIICEVQKRIDSEQYAFLRHWSRLWRGSEYLLSGGSGLHLPVYPR